MSPNIKLNGYLSILIFGYVIILHSYLGHFCLLLENYFFILYLLNRVFDILYGADGNKDTFIVIEQKRLILLSTLLCRGMEYLTIEEVVENWGITSRRIQVLSSIGRLPDVKKFGRQWVQSIQIWKNRKMQELRVENI